MNVCEAIRDRQVVEFLYRGELRIAKITTHGHNTGGTRSEQVRAFQIGGVSSGGGPIPGWRLFHVAEIDQMRALSGEYDPLPGDYNPQDKNLVVHCHA